MLVMNWAAAFHGKAIMMLSGNFCGGTAKLKYYMPPTKFS